MTNISVVEHNFYAQKSITRFSKKVHTPTRTNKLPILFWFFDINTCVANEDLISHLCKLEWETKSNMTMPCHLVQSYIRYIRLDYLRRKKRRKTWHLLGMIKQDNLNDSQRTEINGKQCNLKNISSLDIYYVNLREEFIPFLKRIKKTRKFGNKMTKWDSSESIWIGLELHFILRATCYIIHVTCYMRMPLYVHAWNVFVCKFLKNEVWEFENLKCASFQFDRVGIAQVRSDSKKSPVLKKDKECERMEIIRPTPGKYGDSLLVCLTARFYVLLCQLSYHVSNYPWKWFPAFPQIKLFVLIYESVRRQLM